MADAYDPTDDVSSIYQTGMGGLRSGLSAMPGAQKRSRDIEGNALAGGLSTLQNWDANHQNVALMGAAGAMMGPTRTGGFSESMGNALTAGASGLKWQQQQEMDRVEKIQRLQLAQAALARKAYEDPMAMAGAAFGGLGAAKTGAGTVADFNLYQNPLFKSPTAIGPQADATDPNAPAPQQTADATPQIGASPDDHAAVAAASTPAPAPAKPAQSDVAMAAPDPDVPAPNSQPVAQPFTKPDAIPAARSPNGATGPGMGAMLDRDQQLLQAYRQNPGQFRGPDGQAAVAAAVKRIQDSPQYKAAVKGSEVTAEETAKDPHTLVEEQNAAGQTVRRTRGQVLADVNADPSGQTVGSVGGVAKVSDFQKGRLEENAKAEAKMFEGYQPIQQASQRLDNIGKLLETYQTGKWADVKANAIATARALGINLPSTATANPEAYQKFVKEATAEVMDQVKQMGGRPLVTEIASFQKALMDPNLQPEANASIVKNLKGALAWRQKYIEDYADWRNGDGKNDPNPENFEIAWTKKNPISKYVDAAGKDIAAKGDPNVKVPPIDKLEHGKKYQTARGAAYWDAKRKVFTTDKPSE